MSFDIRQQYSDALWWEDLPTLPLLFQYPSRRKETWSRDRYLGLGRGGKLGVVVSLCRLLWL